VAVEYINDKYIPTPFQDRNAYIEKIVVNGRTYNSTDPKVYSTGTWTPADGCASNFKQSPHLHCNGSLSFNISPDSPDPVTGTSIIVKAKGTAADNTYAAFQILVNGEVAGTYGTREQYQFFQYIAEQQLSQINSIEIRYINDLYAPAQDEDRNLFVEYIQVADTIYSTTSEDSTISSTGVWTPQTGCIQTPQLQRSNMLSCPGYLKLDL
jgi:hypothetical protein